MPDTTRFAAQVRADGRVTIPAEKRRQLNLSPGDYAVVDVRPLEGGG